MFHVRFRLNVILILHFDKLIFYEMGVKVIGKRSAFDHFPFTPICVTKMKFSLSIFDFQIPLGGLYNISKIGNNT